jgi:uncharacterized protein YndB with AHSA1/START domain
MTKFESSRRRPAPADRVFEVASDPESVAAWVPTVRRAEQTGPNLLQVESSGGEQEALWRARAEQRRVEWAAPGSGEYSGWLQVNASDDEPASEVVLHLSFLGGQPAAHGGEAARSVQGDLDAALDRLAELVQSVT